MKNKLMREDGQMIVGGLFSFGLIAFMVIALLSRSHKVETSVLEINRARNECLLKANKISDTLNAIATTNKNILVAFAIAQNAYIDAAQTGVYLSLAVPYWERPRLKSKIDDDTQTVFNAFGTRTRRGLIAAHNLINRQHKLIDKLAQLAPQTKDDWRELTHKSTLCLSLNAGMRDANDFGDNIGSSLAGIVNMGLSPVIGNGKFQESRCELAYDNKKILDLEDLIKSFDRDNQFPHMKFPDDTKNNFEFLSHLSGSCAPLDPVFDAPSPGTADGVNEIVKNHIDSNYESSLKMNLNFAFTHPDLTVAKFNNHAPLYADEFEKFEATAAEKNSVRYAFFRPYWVPQIINEQLVAQVSK